MIYFLKKKKYNDKYMVISTNNLVYKIFIHSYK
jgi:hypothetical protein